MTPLHKIMQALGINQHEAARILGKSQSSVSRWLRGDGEPLVSDLQKLRAEFHRRGIPWDDDHIMGVPDEAA